jgi:hypothetical protein
LLALALCHESQGRTATAWQEFGEVATSAERAKRADRLKVARDHRAALEPGLSKLVIVVPDAVAALPDLGILRDGVPVPRGDYSRAVPVDPGDHVVTALAHGAKPWSAQVHMGTQGDAQVVTIPALGPVVEVAAAPAINTPLAPGGPVVPPSSALSPGSEPPPAASSTRTQGYVVGAMGVTSLGIGTFFGIRAITQSSDAKSQCPTAPACTNSAAIDTNTDAKTSAWISDVALGLGVVGVAAGAYLVFPHPRGSDGATQAIILKPRVGYGTGGVSLEGEF